MQEMLKVVINNKKLSTRKKLIEVSKEIEARKEIIKNSKKLVAEIVELKEIEHRLIAKMLVENE